MGRVKLPWMRRQDVALYLGICENSVGNLIRERVLKQRRPKTKGAFHCDDLVGLPRIIRTVVSAADIEKLKAGVTQP